MRLESALSDAASGLDSVAKRLATLSQNVSNASTPGYVRQTREVASAVAAGDGMGVRTGTATRLVDTTLQATVWQQNAAAADSGTRSDALAAVDAASGTPGAGQDLASLVGALRDGFSTLLNDPSNATQQAGVVTAAAALARGVNTVSGAISAARQGTQDNLVTDVAAANTALQAVGRLSAEIVALRSHRDSTADIEDQRDAAMATASQLTGAKFLEQADGTVLAVSGGTVLPLTGTGPLAIAAGRVAADTPAAAVPQLTVAGQPLGGTLGGTLGGRIGAELSLRDTVLPGLQAGLDRFAQALAGGFAAQGLTLFTNAAGVVPPNGTVAFAQTLQVNPAVTASPGTVRDGTGGTAGAAGSATVIAAVLGTVLATGFGTVAGQAADLVAAHASLAANAATLAKTDTAVQNSLQARLDAGTGVSVDSEMAQMVQLQNSYGANAKVITAVQSMLRQLMDAVQ